MNRARTKLSRKYVDDALKALGRGGIKLREAARSPLFEQYDTTSYQRLFYRIRALALNGQVRIDHDGRDLMYYTIDETQEKEKDRVCGSVEKELHNDDKCII